MQSKNNNRTGATLTAISTPTVPIDIACPTPTTKLRRWPRCWAIISDPMPTVRLKAVGVEKCRRRRIVFL
jgi:hypothetical protein